MGAAMSRRRAQNGAGILTGPGEEGKTFPSSGAALSAGITRAARAAAPCTFYVRDPDGAGLYAIERTDDSGARVLVHTTKRKES